MSCRGAEGKSIGVDEEPTLRNVARFKNNSLNPKTTYHLKIVAVYNDGFEAESEELAFTTPGKHLCYKYVCSLCTGIYLFI